MSVRRIGKSWYADVTWSGKRYRKRSPLNTKQGARELELLIMKTLAKDGNLDALDPKEQELRRGKKLAEYVPLWLERYVCDNKRSERANKRSVLKCHLLPFFGDMRLKGISTTEIQDFKRHQANKGLVDKTINNHLAVLGSLFKAALDDGEIEKGPRIRYKTVQAPSVEFLGDAELARLVAATPLGLWRAMVLVAARAGLRLSELVALGWDDVDLAQGTLAVRSARARDATEPVKNYQERILPMTFETVQSLGDLPRSGRFVFGLGGDPMSKSCAGRNLKRFYAAAGLKPLGWHALRHTYATHLVGRGVPIRIIQALLGHKTLDMTIRYTHVVTNTRRIAVDTLERDQPQHTWAFGGQDSRDPAPLVASRAVRKS